MWQRRWGGRNSCVKFYLVLTHWGLMLPPFCLCNGGLKQYRISQLLGNSYSTVLVNDSKTMLRYEKTSTVEAVIIFYSDLEDISRKYF